MTLKIEFSNNFKKDYKKSIKQGNDITKLDELIMKLANEEKIPTKNKDHQLKGKLKDFRELHIEPDWLLIYQIENDVLRLIGTGSHSFLFKL